VKDVYFSCFLAVIIALIWGFNFVVIQIGLQGVSPFILSFSRFFLMSIPFVFFVKRPSIPFRLLLGYGLLMFAIPFTFLFIAMHIGLSASLASLLLQMQVFFTIFLAFLFLKEKCHIWQMVGASLSFVGIIVVSYHLGQGIGFWGF